MGPQIGSPAEISQSVEMLLRLDGWYSSNRRRKKRKMIQSLLSDKFIYDFLRINEYGGSTWFGKESAETMFFLMGIEEMIDILMREDQGRKKKLIQMEKFAGQIMDFRNAAELSGYDLDRFFEILDQD
jgi:hypothetical protein